MSAESDMPFGLMPSCLRKAVVILAAAMVPLAAGASLGADAAGPASATDGGARDWRGAGRDINAPDGADAPERATRVVARAGQESLTVAEVEGLLRSLSPFQLQAMGHSAKDARRAYVEEVAVRQLLFAAAARSQGLDQRPSVRRLLAWVLRKARLDELRSRVMASSAVSDEAVERFYAEHGAEFRVPERIAIDRILCDSRSEAEAVIVEANKTSTQAAFAALARERSVDKATAMRGGFLGFVAHDGASSEPAVVTDPALFAAASRVHDGEIVPEVVAEGHKFAVVRRRSTAPAELRTLEQEAPAIRERMARGETERKVGEHLRELRRGLRVEVHAALLASVDPDDLMHSLRGATGAPAASAGRAAFPSDVRAVASAAPSSGPRGLR